MFNMVFKVEETEEEFKYKLTYIEKLKTKNVTTKGYVFKSEKMPLMEQRLGFLPGKVRCSFTK